MSKEDIYKKFADLPEISGMKKSFWRGKVRPLIRATLALLGWIHFFFLVLIAISFGLSWYIRFIA